MKKVLALFSLLIWSLAASAGTLTKSHSQGKFSDEEIEATIKAKLAKSKIGKDGIQVHVKNGIATWTGSTVVMQHKGAATRMAKSAGAVQETVLHHVGDMLGRADDQGVAARTGVQ